MKKALALLLSVFMALTWIQTAFAAEYVGNKSDWKITVNSEKSWALVDKVADGKDDTYWHSNYSEADGAVTGKDMPPYYLTVVFPSEEPVSAVEYLPRQDSNNGFWQKIEIYASSDENDAGLCVYSGTAEKTTERKTFTFDKTVSAKKVRIVIEESVNSYGTCAELNFIKGNAAEAVRAISGKTDEEIKKEEPTYNLLTDKTSWTVSASSQISWGAIEKAFDGDKSTNWHTAYTAEGTTITSRDLPPYDIDVVFAKEESVSGLYYTPRQDGTTGHWKKVEIYASSSESDKGELVATSSPLSSTDRQVIPFNKEIKAKHISIHIAETFGQSGACGEIDFITGEIPKEEIKDAMDTSKWDINVNSTVSWSNIRNAFDGDETTYWHSDYKSEGSAIVSHDLCPYLIEIKLPKVAIISGFKMLPRGGGASSSGRVTGYNLYVSDKDEGEMTLISSGTFENNASVKFVNFGCALEAKRINFEVTDGVQGYGVIAELEFIEADESMTVVSVDNYQEEHDKNALYQIDSSTLKASNDLPVWSGSPAAVFDGGAAFWQTETGTTGTVTLAVDMGMVHSFKSISITPRQSADFHGYWLKFNIYASKDGLNYDLIAENYSFGEEKDLNEKWITFEDGVTARYIEFEILEYYTTRVSCDEIKFWQTKEQRDAETAGEANSFVLVIGKPEIRKITGGNEETVALDVAPYITSAGSTLIPLRGLLEEMGVTVDWDGDTQTIHLTKNTMDITMQIQNKLVYVEDARYGTIMYTLSSAPRIRDSRTFVPVRFLSEQLGYTVGWDGATQTITITK